MDISVLIPTYGRAAKLARCLARLARQDLDHARFEVLIGVDGRDEANEPDDEAAQAVHALASTSAGAMRAVVHEFDHAGPGATRNKLARFAKGRLLLLLNDDVLPELNLLSLHLRAHSGRAGRAAMVLGDAPWVRPGAGDDTLFDRLVRETSMIFFYDRMRVAMDAGQAGPEHDWGYRHAWTLNLSLPRAEFERIGGFDERLTFACYEDLEFARRVHDGGRVPVLFRPECVAHHDHRITPDSYLARERVMGKAALQLAAAVPDCAQEIFGRDIAGAEELEYSRAFVERERPLADRLRASFDAIAYTPADAVGGPHAAMLLNALYEQHLPLKRWTWRAGLVEASDAESR
ncbi:MAG: glycosyltransferase [Phycisphaeraceae bacterium]|nr:glycosyltransferase [Phycisphaeraceae bacterium]